MRDGDGAGTQKLAFTRPSATSGVALVADWRHLLLRAISGHSSTPLLYSTPLIHSSNPLLYSTPLLHSSTLLLYSTPLNSYTPLHSYTPLLHSTPTLHSSNPFLYCKPLSTPLLHSSSLLPHPSSPTSSTGH